MDIIYTKISIPPTRTQLVRRERLSARLNESLAHKLTWISAPAGFGKSTLLSSWAERQAFPIAWYTLDEGDNEAERFLTYLLTSLHTELPGPDLLESTAGLRQAQESAAIESLLTYLANELRTVEGPVAIVLDDYHSISSSQIHDFLSFLLENLPPSFHFLIASRQDPGFPVARLRAQRQVLDISTPDLRFTDDEAAEFLRECMGLDIAPEQISELDARTEGWIAGLQLAALSMEGRETVEEFIQGLRGTDRFILDYLAEEVFLQLPALLRGFLLRISLLERFNAELCDVVVGEWTDQAWQDIEELGIDSRDIRSGPLLEFLDSSNLFVVPLDHQRQWYRFHHLFADFLRARLRARCSDEIPELHRRASGWHASQGLLSEAIQHSLAGQDSERAAELIEGQVKPMLAQGKTRALAGWIEALPEDALSGNPRLQLGLAWSYILSDPVRFQSQVQRLMEGIGRGLRADRGTTLERLSAQDARPETQDLLGQFAMLLGYLGRDMEPFESTIALFEAAEAALPEDDFFTRAFARAGLASTYARMGDLFLTERTFAEAAEIGRMSDSPYVYLVAKDWEATVQAQRGRLSRAEDTFRWVIDELSRISEERHPLTGHAFVGVADICREWNELQEALELVSTGIERGHRTMDRDALREGYIVQARILLALGDEDGARHALEQGLRQSQATGSQSCVREAEAWGAILSLGWGDPGAAVRWASRRGLIGVESSAQLESLLLVERIALAKVLAAQGDLGRAKAVLEELLTIAQAGGMGRLAMEARCALAPVLNDLGQRDAAERALTKALIEGYAEGYVRVFLNEGPRMGALLRRVHAGAASPEYLERLLAEFGRHSHAQGLIEPLTERELDVLRLMAEGLTNAEVAAELYIAPSTVKTHVNHIYSKLGVTQRTQAILRARDLRLLQ